MLFSDEDFSKVTFFADQMGMLRVDLDNTNLNDNNFYEDDPEIIIHVKLLAWHYIFKKNKVLKKHKEFMPVAWHPTRW